MTNPEQMIADIDCRNELDFLLNVCNTRDGEAIRSTIFRILFIYFFVY